MDESSQVGELQMDAVEQMNPLEGVGETVSSLEEKQEKTGEDEAELTSPEDVEKLKSLCSLRRLHEKLKSQTLSPGPYEGSRRNSVINLGPSRSLVH